LKSHKFLPHSLLLGRHVGHEDPLSGGQRFTAPESSPPFVSAVR
jgi:hypothetical protein